MAPNMAVKSESWMDLSSICRDLKTNRRLSFQGTNTATTAAAKGIRQQQEHLLIRLRQQSYLRNKSASSTASSLSNLSDSIDISLADDTTTVTKENLISMFASEQHPLLKRQPRKLSSIRESLQRKGRCSRQVPTSRQASPIVRSLTSLSERLGDKFSHLRHSCKQFLYSCNQVVASSTMGLRSGPSREECMLASQLARLGQDSNDSDEHHSKRQFTGDWIRRHYGFCDALEAARPKSLEIANHNQRVDESRWIDVSTSSNTLVSDGHQSTSSSNTATSPSKKLDEGSPLTKTTAGYCFTPATMNPVDANCFKQQQMLLVPQQQHQQVQPVLGRSTPGSDQDYYLEVAKQQQMLLHDASCNSMQPPTSMVEDEDYEDYAVPADETCRLERSQVELVQMIGEGQKGYVFLGKLQSKDGRQIQDVAIKTLKYETDQLIDKLMREAAMMRQLEHPHIIRFIGVCPETPALIAMELAELGELKQYLKLNKHLISSSHLILFTFQISTALSYLESKQYVHRDVAARNVLVCSHGCVKLADFGLSRNLQLEQNHLNLNLNLKWPLHASQNLRPASASNASDSNHAHYVATSRGKLPVRWLAPESLAFRRFTSASDVWMFAVCAWEMFHFGQLRPWASIRNNQVLLAIESGQRLPRPPNCPARLYQMMLQCWSYAPIQRPKFRDLKQLLWSIYLNERAREQLELEQQLEAARQLELEQQRQLMIQHQLMMQQQQERLQRQRLKQLRFNSSQSPLLANYSSTASGYSSAASTTTLATDGHSNNSSRSSSMGSLIKRQQQAAAAAAETSNVANDSQKNLIWLRDHSGSKEETQLRPNDRQERIEANVRRFQRTPGHLLQKQRSQGSIRQLVVTEDNHMVMKRGKPPLVSKVCDDQALDSRWRQTSDLYRDSSRPISEQQLAYVDDQEEDDSSGESLDDFPIDNKLVVTTKMLPSPTSFQQEPAYDGLKANEITATGKSFGNKNKNNQQLHLQELSLAPQRFNQARLRSNTPLVVASTKPMDTRSANKQAEEEEQRQLAIHQRLLGNIRPFVVLANEGRRSAHLESQQQQQHHQHQQVESVDQSLEILESLIKGKTFSNSANCHHHRNKLANGGSKSPSEQRPARPKTAIFNLGRR